MRQKVVEILLSVCYGQLFGGVYLCSRHSKSILIKIDKIKLINYLFSLQVIVTKLIVQNE